MAVPMACPPIGIVPHAILASSLMARSEIQVIRTYTLHWIGRVEAANATRHTRPFLFYLLRGAIAYTGNTPSKLRVSVMSTSVGRLVVAVLVAIATTSSASAKLFYAVQNLRTIKFYVLPK